MSALAIPSTVLAHARRAADEIHSHTGAAVDAHELLTGRAALLGLHARGRISAGGSTRLLPTRDGWWALTLSRDDDVDAVPALIERDGRLNDPWPAVTDWSARRTAADAAARARLLGMPAAALDETPPAPPRVRPLARRAGPRAVPGLLVADLSSMWAGPLCGQLLHRAGATVVKVESPTRLDGTRSGATAFFDWMNRGKLSYAATFDSPGFHELLATADVVIEASRPDALLRRGLGPDDLTARDGRVWLRITGHGVDGGERAGWVAFGDDAAVSGGLVVTDATGPAFCGDAIADPLTGLHAALTVVEALRRGGGELIELSMAATAATAATEGVGGPDLVAARAPAPLPGAAPRLGADNAAVDALVNERRGVTC